VRLESGEIVPLDARVIAGGGTWTDRAGRPAPAAPGQTVGTGARLFGGPFVLEMLASAGFDAQPRPAPVAPTIYDRYTNAVAPASLAYALATAVLTRSVMRTFAALGIAEEILSDLRAPQRYWFQNAAGERLMEFDHAEFGRSGWAEMYGFYQPYLENALDKACRDLPRVDIRHSSRVTALVQNCSSATLTVTTPDAIDDTVTARYVVACDGGNSFVRQHLEIDQDDYGFGEAWMVCDFKLRTPVDLPMMQVCDPRQPTAVVPIGREHQRISFMLNSELESEQESQPDRVWHRAARYLRPDEAELIRVATYSFRSLVARSWRVGRVVLAGDAAHQMPPFLGQGMCSGIRDAQNAAFKLDLILHGRNPDLLDTYQQERDPHVRAVIERGIELGRVQTVRDPVIAAERDRRLISERAGGQILAKIRLPAWRRLPRG
jgi:3-(3-hydroxy-phenyl)propionate hydroxylase/flavoprotein hydroxylase